MSINPVDRLRELDRALESADQERQQLEVALGVAQAALEAHNEAAQILADDHRVLATRLTNSRCFAREYEQYLDDQAAKRQAEEAG